MSVKIKQGTLTDFLDSARDTAREIDAGKKVTRKKTVWVEPEDMAQLLKPERTRMIQYLRTHNRVPFPELVKQMGRTRVSVNRDLELLEKYRLVHTYTEPNPGHGVRKVIQPDFGREKIQLEATV
jgi:predicted transcriptional regulator